MALAERARNEREPYVRDEALAALFRIGGTIAEETLIEAVRRAGTTKAAEYPLEMLVVCATLASREVLSEMLEPSVPDPMRYWAEVGLARLGCEEAVPRLLERIRRGRDDASISTAADSLHTLSEMTGLWLRPFDTAQ